MHGDVSFRNKQMGTAPYVKKKIQQMDLQNSKFCYKNHTKINMANRHYLV